MKSIENKNMENYRQIIDASFRAFTRGGVTAILCLVTAGSAPALAADKTTGASGEEQVKTRTAPVKNRLLAANDESWRAKPPALPPPNEFKMPEVKTYTMPNGLTVKLVEDHRFPYVTTYLGMKTGTTADSAEKLGVSEMAASMLTEGTKKLKSKEIAEEIDFIGGSLNCVADYDFTIMSGSCLSNYQDRLFTLMSDVLLKPSFPDDELKLKKANWIQELTMKRSDPDFLLEERFRKVVFGPHPYGVVSPRPDMISKITQDDLKKFHQANYLPNDSILLVLGDFDGKRIESMVQSSFGEWQKGERKQDEMPSVALHKNRRIYLVDRPGSVQSALLLGNLGIKKKDPEYFATRVMNQILGGSAHSRLFLNIREQKGYTYGAYSNLAARVYPDVFSAGASVRTEVTSPSVKEFLFELDRMRDAKVTQDELDDAKNYIVGQYQLALETQSGLAQRLLEVSLFDLPDDYLAQFSKRIMAVTPEDVQRAAQKVIHSKDLVIAVVGDANKVKSGLESYGDIELYDLNGDLMTTSNPTKKAKDEKSVN